MKKEWYVVNTVSGYEYKVKEKLEMRINSMDLHENIFRVIVPEQKEIEYKNIKELNSLMLDALERIERGQQRQTQQLENLGFVAREKNTGVI